MSYYPGDEYVDWWSINIFDVPQITNNLTVAYLDSAESHLKPVLIGESTPKYVGVLDGQTSWDTWFAPFLNLISSRPGIKMTGYINWNWAEFPQWSDWGDARLEANAVVRQNFNAEMNEPTYLHAATEREYRTALGHTESDPPGQVMNVTVSSDAFPAYASWDAAIDASGISRYLIYSNGELIDFTKKTRAIFPQAIPGETINLTISAVDRAGNEGQVSEAVEFVVPEPPTDPDNLLTNGDFELGAQGWDFQIFAAGALGRFDIDDSGMISGNNSAHLTVQQTTNTNFHIQLRQPLNVFEGKSYVIKYSAKSDQNTTMETWLQQAEAPFTGYTSQTVQLTTDVQAYTDTAFVSQDDSVFIVFMVGNSGLSEIWIDDVVVVEEVISENEDELITNGNFDSGQDSWSLTHFVPGVEGTFEIDTTGVMAGKNSAHITILQNTGTNWHLQLEQPLQVLENHEYAISYQVRGIENTTMEMWFQKATAPFTGYAQRNIDLTTETQTFQDTAFVPVNDNVFMRFMFGTSGLTQIWVDSVSVVDLGSVVTSVEDRIDSDPIPATLELLNPYPNPFNP
ncbi:carbohydrate binding domain-containing protein, partial [bacterium]|nr:carbohydrate binding domain-containing protein [bacterium]